MLGMAYCLGLATGIPVAVIILLFVKVNAIDLVVPQAVSRKFRTNKRLKTPKTYSDQRAYEAEND